jgi:hypothetical protein
VITTEEFKRMTDSELDNWREFSYKLEVGLVYPTDYHDLRNEYPISPEQVVVNKVNKPIPTLNDKKKYVRHNENRK